MIYLLSIAILWGFYFHETSHVRSFEKIKPSRKFPNFQYDKQLLDLSSYIRRKTYIAMNKCTA